MKLIYFIAAFAGIASAAVSFGGKPCGKPGQLKGGNNCPCHQGCDCCKGPYLSCQPKESTNGKCQPIPSPPDKRAIYTQEEYERDVLGMGLDLDTLYVDGEEEE
jgi:hypothetical protein